MTCAEANKIDLVEYLFSLGNTPTKIRGNDYWYLSPFRNEKEASFKVNKLKNVWYDHGAGNGGTVIDFVSAYFNCDVSGALQKLSLFNHTSQKQFISTQLPSSIIFQEVSHPELFTKQIITGQQTNHGSDTTNQHEGRPPFHLHENSLINPGDAAETAIEIIAANRPITDLMLCRYLTQRRIDKNIADRYCYEVVFKFSNKDTQHTAIGFRNSAGGYELRNSFFKLSSSLKYITYINAAEQRNNAEINSGEKTFKQESAVKTLNLTNNSNALADLNTGEIKVYKSLLTQPSIVSQNDAVKNTLKTGLKNQTTGQNQAVKQFKSIAIFEGFFDFLSYQTIQQNQNHSLTDFLILNSLAFFERSLLLMEKHDRVHLYLDNDEAGKKCLDIALKRSLKYKDESSLYKGYKDLNEWVMHFGKLQQKQSLKQSKRIRFP